MYQKLIVSSIHPRRHALPIPFRLRSMRFVGRMVKLADTPALGAGAARHEGSTPSPPTKKTSLMIERCFFVP